MQKMRLKILANHPVQYQVPVWRELKSRGCEINVGYYHQGTAGKRAKDEEFGIDLEWDIDLLNDYPHRIFVDHLPSYGLIEQIQYLPSILAWFVRDFRSPILLVGWFAEVVWLIWVLAIIFRVPVFTISDTHSTV